MNRAPQTARRIVARYMAAAERSPPSQKRVTVWLIMSTVIALVGTAGATWAVTQLPASQRPSQSMLLTTAALGVLISLLIVLLLHRRLQRVRRRRVMLAESLVARPQSDSSASSED